MSAFRINSLNADGINDHPTSYLSRDHDLLSVNHSAIQVAMGSTDLSFKGELEGKGRH